MPRRALVVRLPGGINTGSREGRKYGSQDRLHDMSQATQETPGNQAITLAMVESFDEDSRLLLQAIDKITSACVISTQALVFLPLSKWNKLGPHRYARLQS